eukprot:CAMPEP_0172526622 /NCGR_PEP_ID=MMETSP1067-20121228/1484_1 /TAXON_ID=265564 ORGANISM="Thalassiosira punctigera, Strain Tpunct2005C2" /NCGR_SAMPLE_ID=MMETSP1067 /ASSEMBLY_ACC=CAM_ASM_000444 /LENGTH=993 /DNA_ID=CAMNT_0013310161 /DNA_START=78 /DNA_END=3059 /DNA_ORIENTATION=+
MMLQAAKKSTLVGSSSSSALRSTTRHHGIGSNAIRAFFSASRETNGAPTNVIGGGQRSFSAAVASAAKLNRAAKPAGIVGGAGRNSNHLARAMPSAMGLDFPAGPAASVVAFGGIPHGNPSTMAFLGIRAKSSGAAFRYQAEEEDDFAAEGGAVGRSHHEAWMVNLGRGDDAWLTAPRDAEWFTGLDPSVCPGVDEKGVLRSLPLPNLSAVTRQGAKDYFDNSWTLFEMLFAGLKGEEPFYRPPVHGLRHPQIFYYGHTPCLYINKLRVAGVLPQPVNAYFESIFEVGVDEMLWDDMHKNDMVWPTVSEVYEYRKDVYDTVVDVIMNHPSLDDADGKGLVVNQDHPMWSLFMGFEHERIHLETSSVLFRETPIELVQRPKNWPGLHPSVYETSSKRSRPVEGEDYPANEMIPVRGGSVQLGKPLDFPSYGWDNEYGQRTVSVPDFQASKHMVTNGEYWQFVADGGYRNEKYWCEDGSAWRTHRNMKWPFFWKPVGPQGSHEYGLRTIFEEIPMRWDWPVDVTYYESKAYCRWKEERDGSPSSRPLRVLTEAEHQILRHDEHNLDAARSKVEADKVMVTSGAQFSHGPTGANLNMAFSSHNPVDAFPPSHTGHHDTVGNAWEWTEDHFNPLKNFEAHHVYDDFSTPCFDGKHSMIVGGSFMSTGDEASVFARFHFRPHFLQHSGFRLVASDEDAPATHLFPGSFSGQAAAAAKDAGEVTVDDKENSNLYETEDLLNMYLSLHFPSSGSKESVNPILDHANSPIHGLRFPQRVANLMVALNPVRTNNRALDVGCAVGGASFELAKSFDHVEAFDFSENFVATAKKMQSGDELTLKVPVEGDITEEVSVTLEPGVDAAAMGKVNFFQGDACALSEYADDKQDFGTFDGAILANLLCRLPDPMACLNAMPKIINKGGVVVIVTPFTWLEEYTPRSKWLGGFNDPVSQEPMYSKDKLKEIMEELGFEKIHEEQMPLVIREHQRKYQYIVSEATGWRKK